VSSRLHQTQTVTAEHSGMRVDRFVSDVMGLFPRSQLAHRNVRIHVNGLDAKPSRRVTAGDIVGIEYEEAAPPNIVPEPLDISVIFEDDDVVVIDKPVGMVVHPAAGNWSGTLAQGLMHRLNGGAEELGGEPTRPGIVHRLDKDTSGVLIAAKHPSALEYLGTQFRKRRVLKLYLAIVKGHLPKQRDTLKTMIGRDPNNRKRFAVSKERGKAAVTSYRVLKTYGGYSFVALTPSTGRTHQLRVHMHYLNCPILGDPVYSRRDPRFPDAELMLHAYRLAIAIPADERQRVFTARLPERFRELLRALAADQSAS